MTENEDFASEVLRRATLAIVAKTGVPADELVRYFFCAATVIADMGEVPVGVFDQHARIAMLNLRKGGPHRG